MQILKVTLELEDGESEVQFHSVPDDFPLTKFGIDIEELLKNGKLL